MSLRPKRIQVVNEIGMARSLPTGKAAFGKSGRGPEVVFFGLGPEPGNLPAWFPEVKSAWYVECPEFAAQMDGQWQASIPEGFSPLAPEELTPERLRRAVIIGYSENYRLFPSFWGGLRARRALAHLKGAPLPEQQTIWLPGTEADLLGRELEVAFQVEGFRVERVNPDSGDRPDKVPWLLTRERPRLFFSVNFKGLDSYGGYYHLLREAGARVAVWCVDNPFHLLAGIKSNYWKQLDLFVTDAWFVEPLRRLGATGVHHLPLAASPGLFAAPGAAARADLADRLVFAGRSEFPRKREFFSGIRLDKDVWTEVRQGLAKGRRADFGWWADRLGVRPLWPGKGVRAAGLGAEETGKAWRAACLRQAGEQLTVFGDQGWKDLLPEGADLRDPVDYYDELPQVYRSAACVLNMTSPLLPAGLTQRHFDVWVAGGLLLTDDTPGLSIFPPELVREVSFAAPKDIAPLFSRLAGSASAPVRSAWKECILSSHTYKHRVRFVLDRMSI